MPAHHHNRFKSSILAVFFLLLNGICIAMPGIKNGLQDFQPITATQSGQCNTETEETQLITSSAIQNPFRNSFSFKRNFANPNLQSDCISTSFKGSDLFLSKSVALQKPTYYRFLFRYFLF